MTQVSGAGNPVDGIDLSFNSSPTFVDIDGDGDLDLFLQGGFSSSITFFENTGTNTLPEFTERTGTDNPLSSINIRGGLSFVDIDNDGDLDAFFGSTAVDGAVGFLENIGTVSSPIFTELSGVDNPLINVTVASISGFSFSSFPTFVDVDGDGDLDAVIGDSLGFLSYFENTGTAEAAVFEERIGADNPFNGVVVDGFSTPVFTDVDGDGHLDLFVGDNNGLVRRFEPASDGQITITVNNVDDPSVVSGSFIGAVTEGNDGDADVTATGDLTITDVDADDTPSFADVASTLGGSRFG
ncbi:MAG: VCBS repeat-containing protein, partial [Kordiimonadaceae bacterium]|nr:VCBS repeat-containing protein [Kordiimonadaceae bacterium]